MKLFKPTLPFFSLIDNISGTIFVIISGETGRDFVPKQANQIIVKKSMTKLIADICEHIYSMKLTFSVGIDVPAIQGKEEFYSLEVPTTQDDRRNLKYDRDIVVSDYRKAIEDRSCQLTD